MGIRPYARCRKDNLAAMNTTLKIGCANSDRLRPMSNYEKVYNAIVSDPRYQRNLDWGEARPGHPEGTVRAHIAEIEANLDALRPKLSASDYWKLKILIHTHDSF